MTTRLFDPLTGENHPYARGVATGLLLAATAPTGAAAPGMATLSLVADRDGYAIGGYLEPYIDNAQPSAGAYGLREVRLSTAASTAIRNVWADLTAAGQFSERDFIAGTDAENDTGIIVQICSEADYTPTARGDFISGIYEALRIITELSQ